MPACVAYSLAAWWQWCVMYKYIYIYVEKKIPLDVFKQQHVQLCICNHCAMENFSKFLLWILKNYSVSLDNQSVQYVISKERFILLDLWLNAWSFVKRRDPENIYSIKHYAQTPPYPCCVFPLSIFPIFFQLKTFYKVITCPEQGLSSSSLLPARELL